MQVEQLQGGDYVYSAALGTGNNLVVNLPSTYTKDSWDLKTPIVISSNANNTGSVTIQLSLGGMTIGTFPVYKANKSQLVRNDIIAGIPFVILLDRTKTFFYIINGNYLSLIGGALTGNLTVDDTLTVKNYIIGTNPISLRAVNSDATTGLFMQGATSSSSSQQGYALRTFQNNLMINALNNGVVGQGIAEFDSNTNTFDFSTERLTKNGIPVTIESQFANKLEGNGYQYLPGGLIMQWGHGDIRTTGYLVTFPKPFSAGPLCVVVNDRGGQYPCGSSNWTSTTFLVRTEAEYFAYTWFALGVA